jgi:hypothetical protein
MTMPALTVGQKLLYVEGGQNRIKARESEPREVEIVKIGRQYATLKGNWGRINIKTLEIHGEGYTSPGRCFLSTEHWEQHKAAERTWNAFGRAMGSRWRCPEGLTAERIREAAALLGIELLGDGEAQ